jgi:peptidoglycan/xylan/chitin deacetylase (PgdA/CDA1 family)
VTALSSLKARAEKLLSRAGASAAILMYHRVAEEEHDPWNLCVSPERFAEQMAFLQKAADCVDLLDVQGSKLTPRSGRARIAVTFDDGYRDNLTRALPVLERYGIPATVFVVSGSIGRSREFWWDALERCLLRPQRLPERLELDVAGMRRRFWLGNSESSDPAWRADDESAPGPRESVFLELWKALVGLDTERQDAVLVALMEWACIHPEPAPERRPMTSEELAQLAAHPLIRIGCHTVTHRSLPSLPAREKEREIAAARSALEAGTGGPIEVFSYPYGRVDAEAAAIVGRSRFSLACTSRPAPVTPLANRWALPRLQVTDRGGAKFASWLCGYLPQLSQGNA